MALATNSSGSSTFSGINVTPLVDIMLVLLVIFMVTARLIVSQTLPLDLPKAASGGEQQIVFAVSVATAGKMPGASRRINDDEALCALARQARANHPDLRAVIHADQTVSYGRIVRVMDLLKQGGIGKIAFGVTPTSPEPRSN